MTDLRKGDTVAWKSHGGTAHGKVEKKVIADTTIKSHQIRASSEDPQYIVRSNNGGAAAHKPSALTKE